MNITKRGDVFGSVEDLSVVNEALPAFTLIDKDNNEVTQEDLIGTPVLISVFPDINTSVCDRQTRHFFEQASKYPNLKIVNVSNNTIEQLTDWCATAGIDVTMLSDEKLSFGQAMGLVVEEVGVLGRSVFLTDKTGTLVYKEVMNEITDEPNYDALFAVVDAA